MTVKRYAADEASYRVGEGLGVVDGRGVPVGVGVAEGEAGVACVISRMPWSVSWLVSCPMRSTIA